MGSEKAFRRGIPKSIHWIFLGLIALITVCMDVHIAYTMLDGDASQHLYHGWTIAGHNNPFTQDVYFSTELRLLDIPFFFSLPFSFVKDWTLARIFASIIMQTYYVCSFLYVCKNAGLNRRNAVFAAAMLLVPFSTPYARIVLYHMHYIIYLANSFWMLGLTLRIITAYPQKGWKALWPYMLLAGFWILAGMNGMRYMMIFGLPMLASAAILFFGELREYRFENRRLIGKEEIRHTRVFCLLHTLAFSCVCFAIGYIINQRVLLPFYGVGDSATIFFRPQGDADEYVNLFHSWLRACGIRDSELSLVGVRGIALIAALFGFGYLLVVSIKSCFEQKPVEQRLMHCLLGMSFIVNTVIFVFDSSTGRSYELYYVPVAAMALPALAQEINILQKRDSSACRKLLIILACICFLYQGAYTWRFLYEEEKKLDTWSGLFYTETDTVDQVYDCVEFMQENDYSHGLISYWYASPMVELSDGELSVIGLEEDYEETQKLSLKRWGTSKSVFAPEKLPEKVIVFIKHEDYERFENTFPEAELMHMGWIFSGYEVDATLIE